MTEWRNPEPPASGPEPEPAPGLRWAPESTPSAGDQPDGVVDPRYVAQDPQAEASRDDSGAVPDEGAQAPVPVPAEPVAIPDAPADVVPPAPQPAAEPAPEEVAPFAPEPVAQEPAAPESAAQEPAAQEPAAQDTAAQDTAAQDTAVPEPVTETPAPSVTAPAPEQPAAPVEPAPQAPAAYADQPEPEVTQPHAPVFQQPAAPVVQTPVPPPAADVTAPTAALASAWGTPVPTGPGVAESQPTPPSGAIFRDDAAYVQPESPDAQSEEAQKLAAERAARREAREAALTATVPAVAAAPEPVVVHKRTNDKFFGSLGLFLLRLVTAAIFVVRGLNILADLESAQTQFASTVIPYPQIMAIVTGVACLLIALSLLLGLLTRIAGLGVLLIAGGVLAFVLWGPWSPFLPGQSGFIGEYELLLAGVGLLFLLIGGGGWSVDRSFRAGRERDRAERQLDA